MTACYCVAPVERELRTKKAITAGMLRSIAVLQPITCNRPDCSPGGCRKHVVEFLTGVASRAGIPMRGQKR